MNSLIHNLKKICEEYPLHEKRLVVPSYSAGHMLCESLARASGGWLNLYPVTVTGLAQQLAAAFLADKNISFLNNYLSTTIVEEVFLSLKEAGRLGYFNRSCNSTGVVKAIASTLLEIRKTGIAPVDLYEESFENPDKAKDLKALLKAYGQYLEKFNYIDQPGLLNIVLEMLPGEKNGDEAIYILPSFLQLYPLEEKLLIKLAGERLMLLKGDPVFGLAMPGSKVLKADKEPDYKDYTAASDSERLPWLYKVDSSSEPFEDDTLAVYHAYGMRNEVKEVFRRIQQDNIPLDMVTVAYTSSEYIPLFYSLARRTGLNLTIEEGIPVSFTAPGRVLTGLVKWMKSDYSAGIFKDLLTSGDISIRGCEDVELSPLIAARMLCRAGIGWGGNRYKLLKSVAANLKKRGHLNQSKQAECLSGFFERLISRLHVPGNGKISFRELTSSLAGILTGVVNLKNDTDANGLKSLVSCLQQAGQLTTFKLKLDDALKRVENLVTDLYVGASGPQPGHLHLAGYRGLVWSGRPYTFIVGLDANNFPGSGRQDPVLLDGERKCLHPGLPLGADRPLENLYYMALALATRRGRVTLSFSSHDLTENRPVYPSSVLLQVCRLQKKDSSLDYTSLLKTLGKPAGYCTQDGKLSLDELEWWAGKALTSPGLSGFLAGVKSCYRNIDEGTAAKEARDSMELTEYDGWIQLEKGTIDPRSNKQQVLSSSMIEELASCPFAYFLRFVLHILPPEEIEYNPEYWLDAKERGEFLHELFYNFMRALAEGGEKPSLAKHLNVILKMASELVEIYKNKIPPPSEIVFERELADINRCCELFLKGEEMESDSYPTYFEVPFGLGPEAVEEAGCGLVNPLKIETGDSFFMLRGKIDRIDRLKDGTYLVLDYKTGGAGRYEENRHLYRGRQLQHALYSIAAEAIINKLTAEGDPQVKYSGYYFPTEKGAGRRVLRTQTGRAKLHEALESLFDLLAGGIFVAAEDEYKCVFCDYKSVCNYPKASEKTKILTAMNNSLLQPWRRLMKID